MLTIFANNPRVVDTPEGRLTVHSEDAYVGFALESVPWSDPAAVAAAGGEVIKFTPTRQVIALPAPAGSGFERRVFCKRYVARGSRDILSAALLGSRARREFNAAAAALAASVNVARPVMLGHLSRWGIVTRSIIVTEGVDHDGTAEDIWSLSASNARRWEFVHALGEFVRHIHDAGLYHDDLAATHILTKRTEDSWEFVLIDLMNASVGRVGNYSRAKNLYQVMRSLSRAGMGPGGRVRLVRGYLAGGGDREETGDLSVRKWWRRIECARRIKRGYYGASRRYPPRTTPVAGGR